MMRRSILPLILTASLAATSGAADDHTTKPWQARLNLELPLPLPTLKIEPVNPYWKPLEKGARFRSYLPPKKVETTGTAVAVMYVDERGRCAGVIPVESPLPGFDSAIAEELSRIKFVPAKVNGKPVATWIGLSVKFQGKIKGAVPISTEVGVLDPKQPPLPPAKAILKITGRLAGLPYVPLSAVTDKPIPRRVSLRIPSRKVKVGMQLLIHVNAMGRCDKFVPIVMASGLESWVKAFLSSWRVQPASGDAGNTDSWITFKGSFELNVGSLYSVSLGVVAPEECGVSLPPQNKGSSRK